MRKGDIESREEGSCCWKPPSFQFRRGGWGLQKETNPRKQANRTRTAGTIGCRLVMTQPDAHSGPHLPQVLPDTHRTCNYFQTLTAGWEKAPNTLPGVFVTKLGL